MRGKERFTNNYWNCVLAYLLVMAVVGTLSWLSGGMKMQEITNIDSEHVQHITVSFHSSAANMLSLLLTGPLTVGLKAYFLANFRRSGIENDVTSPFKEAFTDYPRKLGGMLWMVLFVFLWAFLLVIPGIIKAISYSMTPYILAEHPDVKAKDALKLSMRMMEGHKMECFTLGISFLGWIILSILTLGVVNVFYVGPYMESTFAAYQIEIENDALRKGIVTAEQLEGTQIV